jgi:hypothetical protein
MTDSTIEKGSKPAQLHQYRNVDEEEGSISCEQSKVPDTGSSQCKPLWRLSRFGRRRSGCSVVEAAQMNVEAVRHCSFGTSRFAMDGLPFGLTK